ncbi:MAG TPA: heavy-metal-associated domain-containing protein [Thermomicrobiales bacterium]|nr:heavy-metal-associated domain-containing protein [Thermomicrobiales bacterium]
MLKTYHVPDIHCDHCVASINRELGEIEGVGKIDVDLEAKLVQVEVDESVSEEQIIAGLYEAGFDVAEPQS